MCCSVADVNQAKQRAEWWPHRLYSCDNSLSLFPEFLWCPQHWHLLRNTVDIENWTPCSSWRQVPQRTDISHLIAIMAQLYWAVKEKRKKEKVRKWKRENLKLMLCGVRIPSSILLQVLSPADIYSVTFVCRSRHNAHRNKPHVASQASLSSVHVNVVLPILLPLHFVLAQACLPLDSLLPLTLPLSQGAVLAESQTLSSAALPLCSTLRRHLLGDWKAQAREKPGHFLLLLKP